MRFVLIGKLLRHLWWRTCLKTIQICQDTLYRLYCERLDDPQCVAASRSVSINATNDIPISLSISDIRGPLKTQTSDFLSAAFQPIPTMPNSDLVPTPNDIIGQSGQLQTIAHTSSSNSVIPFDSGYGSDSLCNWPDSCSTHVDTSFSSNNGLVAREMYYGPETELDMYGQPFLEPDWEFDTNIRSSNTCPSYGTDRHKL
jgi:hypothetical protein